MKAPRYNIGALGISFGTGLIISLILPCRLIAIIISVLIILLSYIFIKCYR